MELYSRDWRRLEDRRGAALTLEALMVFLDHEVSWIFVHCEARAETPMSNLEDYLLEVFTIYDPKLPNLPAGVFGLEIWKR